MADEGEEVLREPVAHEPKDDHIPDHCSQGAEKRGQQYRVRVSDLAERYDRRSGGEDGGEEHPRDEAPDHFRFFCGRKDVGQDLRLDEYDGDQDADRDKRDILQEQEARVISAVFHAMLELYILRSDSDIWRKGRDREYAFLPQLKNSPPLVFGRVRDSRPVALDRYPASSFRIPPSFSQR